MTRLALSSVGLALLAATGLAQQPATAPATLSAREIFYSAEDAPAAPATAPKTAPKGVVAQRRSGTRVVNHALKPTGSSGNASSAASEDTAQAKDNTDSGAGQVQLAEATDRTYPPMGLRYAVYRLTDGTKEPVEADTVFHSNDHIQFSVDVNAPGYLYVVTRGSSGRWSVLFPASDSDPSSALVQPHHTYDFPPGQMITFTEPAGKEELFLFLSRQPVRSTEDLVLQMSNGKQTPVSAPDKPFPHATMVEAFNRMDDSQIGLLRTAYSRDLIVEKVTPSSPVSSAPEAPAKDNSVYVVNPSTSANSHVVADITFKHE